MASKKNNGLVGGAITPVREALFGGNTDDEDAQSAYYRQKALEEFDKIKQPGLNPIDFDDYEWLGDYSPAARVDAGADVNYDDIAASLMGPSAFEKVQTDPRLRDEQMASLDALREISAAGGMTASDKANLARIQNDNAAADRGRRDAIRSNMAARGMGGGGMDLLAQLQSSQASTDRAAQQGLDVAGMAQDRALAAIEKGGTLAGGLRSQDFGEQSAVAQARDAINQFNAQNSQRTNEFNSGNQLKTDIYNRDMNYDANKTNAGFTNDASKASWQGRQDTANRQVDNSNQAKTFNQYKLPQQDFQNRVDVAKGKAGAYDQQSGYYDKMATREKARAKDDEELVMKGGSILAKGS